MSLLLDALKRAEQAKRAKAEADPAGVKEPVVDRATASDAALVTPNPTPTPSSASQAPSAPLSASQSTSPRLGRTVAPNASITPAGTSKATSAPMSHLPPSRSPTPHSPSSRLPSSRSPSATLLTQSQARVPVGDRLALVNDNAVPTERIGNESASSTKISNSASTSAKSSANAELARTVFNAKHSLTTDTRAKPWLAPLIACGIVLVGLVGWYAWEQISRSLLAPAQISPSALASASTAIPATAPVSALPNAALNTGQPATKAASINPAAVTNMPPPMLPALVNNPSKTAPLRNPSIDEGGDAKPLSRRDLLAQNLKQSRNDRDAPVRLKLAQSVEAPAVNPDLAAGYAALTRGDAATAATSYARAVQASPYNLDAHLGLATAAAFLGDTNKALKHYSSVLELDPRNSTALAGILALNPGRAANLEVELKTLLAKDANSAALNFALGNLYASENRWTEAQQVFFEAYRLDSNNADFMFNLAISLDHLNQSRLALEYYQKALTQAIQVGGAQFDRATAQRRMSELQTAAKVE